MSEKLAASASALRDTPTEGRAWEIHAGRERHAEGQILPTADVQCLPDRRLQSDRKLACAGLSAFRHVVGGSSFTLAEAIGLYAVMWLIPEGFIDRPEHLLCPASNVRR